MVRYCVCVCETERGGERERERERERHAYHKGTLVYIHVRKLCESVKIGLSTNIGIFYYSILVFQALYCIAR